jgi:molybdopterin-guanine dinucleotide biosynthesis protein A
MNSAIAASAIILAGGRSSRIGRPKAALDFGGVSLLTRIISELERRFAEIVVVAAPESEDSLQVDLRAAKVVRDETAYPGPLDALRRGLEAVGNQIAFACSCDLPLLDSDVAAAIVAMLGDFDAAIPIVGGKLQPLHAAYRKRCAIALAALAARGESRLGAITDAVSTRRIVENDLLVLDPQLDSFFNLNTPDDYQRALEMARVAIKTRR